MDLNNVRILLTGAGGGIGTPVARQLAAAGARLFMVGRDEAGAGLAEELRQQGADARYLFIDLLSEGAASEVAQAARQALGGVDLLVNLAGAMSFESFAAEDPQVTERLLRLNTLVPMQLARAVLPGMLAQQRGRIVNIGSIFGSIGFAYFATYSATKFALRGFSEALRRELAGCGVGVTYIAPRAVKTGFNTDAVYRMAQVVKMSLDEPETVARAIVAAIRAERDEAYIGWPEKLFVRVNALWPRLVDSGVRKKNQQAAQFVRPASTPH
ncbi:MAG: short chain dehydrogenase [Proteobacteria bacterium]|nr:MAG: short chain dehydrogenase [Pseudomonadota bacterium]